MVEADTYIRRTSYFTTNLCLADQTQVCVLNQHATYRVVSLVDLCWIPVLFRQTSSQWRLIHRKEATYQWSEIHDGMFSKFQACQGEKGVLLSLSLKCDDLGLCSVFPCLLCFLAAFCIIRSNNDKYRCVLKNDCSLTDDLMEPSGLFSVP